MIYNKHNKGFTLIEVIIYIALFSLLMGSAFVTAYQLIDGSGKLSTKNTVQEEGNFVMRKLNWTLTGISNITMPSKTNLTSTTLAITKYDGNVMNVRLAGDVIEIRENGGAYLPITTANVKVSDISFEFIPAIGSGTAGIKATITINDSVFTITKYMRV
jgi:prepilin-type N-terminal cleavage/methylation domain-containing protein